ncbi:CRISPR-associated endonuclease Cas2 [Helicobacter cetorum]|uniref:CRISPR-associated endoribonuclease Cas2 n=1 Tax=Helicobacter cetorum (strain ATCC BAA-429 / MIT 00-7128) TaxID=182217 RepID=I0EP28_HELC0|nr:CRISPR-associated endonuclease Cas2 [Helicobacter cetorum]AFI04697.1 CRISPR-associated Cas2 family protein [Helicobacter cetorum MIT 00-7128]
MKFLITYDIIHNKKRKLLAEELEKHGTRVNLSVFECELTETKFKQLVFKIKKMIRSKNGNVRFYRLCSNCEDKSFEIGEKRGIFKPYDDFI